MEELISIQKYAATRRQSIHNVIKKTMTGELRTVTKIKNGKEITYIVLNDEEEKLTPLSTDNLHEEEIDYKKAYEDLNKEYLVLKTKYDKLIAG